MARNEASYVAIFVFMFLFAAGLAVVIAKGFDSKKPLGTIEMAGLNGSLPFPDVYPRIPPPAADPNAGIQCINYCASQTTGKIVPCPTTKLTPCTSDYDCESCASRLPLQKLTCQSPSADWQTVADDQVKMNNDYAKYCLPTREKCLDTFLASCATTDDCRRCTDTLLDGVQLTCNLLTKGALVDVPNADGSTKTMTVAVDGRYCLPEVPACNPTYGTARWSAQEGWKCVCKYPSVFGGPQCDQPIACRSKEVNEDTKSKQQLLLNTPGVNGAAIGTPWTFESGVDPNKCLNAQNVVVDCTTVGAVQPTVACQCDGVQIGTGNTFTYDSANPRTCRVDPCHVNALGGRTWNRAGVALPTIPNQPATTCACSGADSSLWTIVPKVGTLTGQEYTFKGYCTDFTIPNTKIKIVGNPANVSCFDGTNKVPTKTGLVPGRKVVNGAEVDTCAADPCAGSYSDSAYRTSAQQGIFDASTGTCACTNNVVAKQIANCQRTINPVCSTCVSACDGDLNTLCPTAPGNNCGNKRCITNPDGTAKCDCGVGCVYQKGVCWQTRDHLDVCSLARGYDGICKEKDDTCRLVAAFSEARNSCGGAIGAAPICSSRTKCGATGVLGCGDNDVNIHCGGSTDAKFKPAGSSQQPWDWTV